LVRPCETGNAGLCDEFVTKSSHFETELREPPDIIRWVGADGLAGRGTRSTAIDP